MSISCELRLGLKVPQQLLQASSRSCLTVFDEYLKISGKPIERSIRGELSGDFEKLMLAVGKSAPAWRVLQKHATGLAGVGGLSARASGVGVLAGPGFREHTEAPSGWVGMLHVVPKGHGCSEAGGTGEARCRHPSPCLNFPTVKCIRSTAEYFAERLYKAMKVSGSPLLQGVPHSVVGSRPEEGSPCHRVLLEGRVTQVHGDRSYVTWGLCSSFQRSYSSRSGAG